MQHLMYGQLQRVTTFTLDIQNCHNIYYSIDSQYNSYWTPIRLLVPISFVILSISGCSTEIVLFRISNVCLSILLKRYYWIQHLTETVYYDYQMSIVHYQWSILHIATNLYKLLLVVIQMLPSDSPCIHS